MAELLALESHKYVLLVAGITEMKKNDDNDAAEKKEKLNIMCTQVNKWHKYIKKYYEIKLECKKQTKKELF